jgi:thiol-disulfide isomerase/thioredoxin
MKLKICFKGTPMPYKIPIHRLCHHLLLLIMAIDTVSAQTSKQPGSIITNGQPVPNVTITNLLNYPTKTAKISGFNGKLLILDFMNTYCGSCIEALPELQSLQQRFGDKIQIMVVIDEKATRVNAFLKNNAIAQSISLPVVYEDVSLKKLFPHKYVPHEVWIYHGVVMAITGAQYVTAENINTILEDKPVQWPVKTDLAGYDYHEPILVTNPVTISKGNTPVNLYYTALTGHLIGVATRKTMTADSIKQVQRISFTNYSVLDLYLTTLNDRENFPLSHVQLNTRRPENLKYINRKEYRDVWDSKNTFCYEGVFPLNAGKETINHKIGSDLDVYLHLKSAIINHETQCYQLVRDSAGNESTSAYAVPAHPLEFISVQNLLKRLNHDFIGIPFFSDLDPAAAIHVKISEDQLSNIESLEKILKAYHLRLEPVRKVVRMFTLSDDNPNTPTQP